MSNKKTIKLFEAFAGIGAQHKALKNISNEMGWNIQSVGIVEWFIPAIIAYQSIHYPDSINKFKNETFDINITISNDSKKPTSQIWKKNKLTNSFLGHILNQSQKIAHNHFDITSLDWNDVPDDIDIFTYSFPCQDISNQGKQKGFHKGSSTRSGLLWEIDRILLNMKKNGKKLPKYLLLENVRAIIQKKHIETFKQWLVDLEKYGYESKWYLLNAKDFGSPQNRERVFAISVLKEHKKNVNFSFPIFTQQVFKNEETPIKSILNIKYPKDNYLSSLEWKEPRITKNNIKKFELINYTNFQSENYIFDINYSGPTLTASGAMSRIKLMLSNKNVRYMQPDEAIRYMGFDISDFNKLNKWDLISKSKIIYLAGNSISIEVLENIFRSLKF